MSKEVFKETIKELVETFERNIDVYKTSDFKEAHLRTQFIDPMFEALGWDMNNRRGYAEQYKDVVHEDSLKIEGKQKAPDYSFRIDGGRKFFLEAKKPSVKIKTDYDPAFQLRRYAWSAHLPISILSDFEEFAIYDTTIKPKSSDSANISRLEYFTYKEYIEKSDWIYDTFSREAIPMGSFDKYVKKEKRGTEVVDKEFLKEIESWREILAKDIAKNNSSLDIYDLNFAVQKVIDRIIFLRIAEDRGIENYENLKNIVKSKDSYKELVKYFKTAWDRYDSGLFSFDQDKVTEKLVISDRILDKILENTYLPKSPYEFSVISVELLGKIYEQFLGKVIRLTPSRNAIIEEKPEVRKAGGVYYTPQYIVEYIVKNTVGELVKNKTPKEVEKITVLDPACGSGSFLIRAYEYLLDWHIQYYEKLSEKEKEKLEDKGVLYKRVDADSGVINWNLTTKEKKKIMLNNIYGVDIDEQAVEVTKLSLALKMLENENQETIGTQMKLFAERILPDLGSNIKCGNSLIGSDYWDGKDLSKVSEEEIKKVKAFDWELEFKEIIKGSGFDAVIGNPPYISIQSMQSFANETVSYVKSHYETASNGSIDMYVAFIEKGIILLSDKGLMSYITPHKFFTANMGYDLRQLLIKGKLVKEIIDFGTIQIFDNATTYTTIMLYSKGKNRLVDYVRFESSDDYTEINDKERIGIDYKDLDITGWVFSNKDNQSILSKIKIDADPIQEISTKVFKGSSTGNDNKFVVSKIEDKATTTIVKNKDGHTFEIETNILKSFVNAEDIRPFYLDFKDKYLIFPYDDNGKLLDYKSIKQKYPLAFKYFEEVKTDLRKRKTEISSTNYYKYSAARSLLFYRIKKILVPDILISPRFTLDMNGEIFHGPAIHSIILNSSVKVSYEAVLGILSSRLFWFFIKNTSTALRGDAYRLTPMYINPFPIRFYSASTDKYYELLTSLVQKQILSHANLNEQVSPAKKKIIQNQIDTNDRQINELVYGLYGLSKEEIEVIEKTI